MNKATLHPTVFFLAAWFAFGTLELVGSGSAMADNPPSYATVPSYATPEQTIQGRIASISGQYSMTVHDNSGYLDNVALHHGTIINPIGLTLAPGMSVTILGYNGGSVFQANEIDTPYRYAAPPPPTAYYGGAWWYPNFAFVYGYGGPRYYGPWGYPGFYYGYGARGYWYRGNRGYSARQPWPTRWPSRTTPYRPGTAH